MELTPPVPLSDKSGKIFSFKDTKSLITFLSTEEKYWVGAKADNSENSATPSNNHTINIAIHFEALLGKVESTVKTNNSESQSLRSDIHEFIQQLQEHLSTYYLWSSHPLTKKYLDILSNQNETIAESFLNISLQPNFRPLKNIQGPDNFIATMLAYEYEFQDSNILKRRKSEKSTLAHLRTQFESAANDANEFTDNAMGSHESWTNGAKEEVKNQREHEANKHKEQLSGHSSQFDGQLSEWKENITALQETYKNHLMLEQPAEYWSKSAERHRSNATRAIYTLAIASTIALAILIVFFWQWLSKGPTELSLVSMQGGIIFTVVIAIFGYILKIISRIIFSSLHLARDAEERQQLTYVYLALSKEGQIAPEEREIVLTSLFSRAESGLLVNDHGPTLPMAEIIRSTRSTPSNR